MFYSCLAVFCSVKMLLDLLKSAEHSKALRQGLRWSEFKPVVAGLVSSQDEILSQNAEILMANGGRLAVQ